VQIRDAGPGDRDLAVEALLASKSPLLEWTVAGLDDSTLVARVITSWNFDVARATGGILVVDDGSGCLLWAGTQRGEEAKRLASRATMIGRMMYPPGVPLVCQQRLYDTGRATRTRRLADLFSRPIRLASIAARTPDLRADLLHVFVERVGRLERECVTVTTDADSPAQLQALGFQLTREVAAFGTRPRLQVFRRPNRFVL
jgi:hypothetical protein